MTSYRRLAAAAAVSLVLHALVIAGNWLPVAKPEDGLRELDVRLAPLPKMKPAAAAPKKTRAPRRAVPPPGPPVEFIAAASPLAFPEPQPETAPDEAAAPEAQESQRLALAAESSTAIVARNLPRRGSITYTVLYGSSQTPVGRVVQSWRADSESYTMASEAETVGFVDLFSPQRLNYRSTGRITAQGLRPDSFAASRTRRGRTEVAEARFDWDGGSLTYGMASEQPKNVPLPADAQDLISFVYQFVVAPPTPGHHRIPITTGSRFEVYDVEVGQETSIDTPIGTLKALPVKQVSRPGSESIEVWLAADYRYLPVRIRHFDREGRYSGEQVASEIRVSDE